MITSSRTLGKAQALILACMLVFPIAVWLSPAAVAQQRGAPLEKEIPAPSEPYITELSKYAAKGYSIIGPMSLVGTPGESLFLFTGKEPYQVPLKGKTVTAKDENAQTISLGKAGHGSKIYVCSGKSEVVVFVIGEPQTGPRKPIASDAAPSAATSGKGVSTHVEQ